MNSCHGLIHPVEAKVLCCTLIEKINKKSTVPCRLRVSDSLESCFARRAFRLTPNISVKPQQFLFGLWHIFENYPAWSYCGRMCPDSRPDEAYSSSSPDTTASCSRRVLSPQPVNQQFVCSFRKGASPPAIIFLLVEKHETDRLFLLMLFHLWGWIFFPF